MVFLNEHINCYIDKITFEYYCTTMNISKAGNRMIQYRLNLVEVGVSEPCCLGNSGI